jgi:phage tail-like protein
VATGDVKDPFGNYNFLVEIDGISRGSFQQVTGFDSSIDLIEHREGGDNSTVRKIPGRATFSNIQLRWGMTDELELYQWHRNVLNGVSDRRNGSIVMLDRQRQEVARWNFVRAWPVRYDGPDANAEQSDIAIEAVELAHEGLERVK